MTNDLRTWRTSSGLRLADAANALGVTQAMLSRWETGSRRIPAERVASISAYTGLPRHVLRPDIFGPYEHMQAQIFVETAAGSE